MLRPKIPVNPTITIVAPPAAPLVPTEHPPTPAPTVLHSPAPVPARPTVQLTPGALITIVAGGTAAVLIIGTVLVSLLLAVAVTAASVAVCAVVLRSMLNNQHKH
ncbi:hypothetical protein ACIP9H_11380 [Streptomyces sp. NPDC088732]|uniref:hypothetical protein n=1 Tax=Streptomyces sp. NPDC088732 TaxID=3365879 RepID=UPI00380B5272